MNSLPKPLVIGVVVLLVLIAGFVAFRSFTSGGDNDYNKADIERAQREHAKLPNDGRTMPSTLPQRH